MAVTIRALRCHGNNLLNCRGTFIHCNTHNIWQLIFFCSTFLFNKTWKERKYSSFVVKGFSSRNWQWLVSSLIHNLSYKSRVVESLFFLVSNRWKINLRGCNVVLLNWVSILSAFLKKDAVFSWLKASSSPLEGVLKKKETQLHVKSNYLFWFDLLGTSPKWLHPLW